MTVSLTTYLNKTASVTLTTANELSDTLGSGSAVTKSSLIGTSSGYGEVYAQGNSGAWAAAGSIGSPSGNGWLYDSINLENQQIIAGNWTPTLRLTTTVGTIVTDVYLRAYKRSSGGVYILINTFLFSGKTVTTSGVNIGFSAASVSAIDFVAGDKLYVDVWLDITTNSTGSGAANIQINESSPVNTGITSAQLVTPGYQQWLQVISLTEEATGSETVVMAGLTLATVAVNEQTNPATGVTTDLNIGFVVVSEQANPATGTTTVGMIEISAPGQQMDASDLAYEYNRIMGSGTGPILQFLATVYYGMATNTQVIYGELDALLQFETMSQLHVMRTPNDVSNFVKAWEYAGAVLADTPVGYYRLSEASGLYAYDYTGRQMHASINGGVTLGKPGPLVGSNDTAMKFDGSSGYLGLPAAINTANWQGLSFDCWFKLTNTGFATQPTIAANAIPSASNTGFSVWLDASGAGVHFDIGNGSTYASCHIVQALTTGWYYLFGMWNGTTITLYLTTRGGTQYTATISLNGAVGIAANAPLVGHNPAGSGDYLPATLAQVAIYKGGLSAGRELAHYNAAINP